MPEVGAGLEKVEVGGWWKCPKTDYSYGCIYLWICCDLFTLNGRIVLFRNYILIKLLRKIRDICNVLWNALKNKRRGMGRWKDMW